MNRRPEQHTNLSQSDADLLSHLIHLAKKIEPDPIFKAQLEKELLQARQSALKGANPMNLSFRRLNRRLFLVACASLIAVIFSIPTITSRQFPEWAASLFNSTVDPRANAQTIAQLIETGQFILQADAQEYNEDTQEVRASGNATFTYLEAQIQASADEIRFVPTGRQVILSGNVQILQRGERLQGTQAICSLEQKQCNLSQD